jgi:Spy/CpxP family protein refolding chaperone
VLPINFHQINKHMKTNKTVMMTMLFLVMSMASVLAQGQLGNGTPEERATQMTERMKTSLKLTDDQVAKVQAANLQRNKDMAAARESGEDMRTSMQAVMEKYNAALQKILTPEQFKTYQESRSQGANRFNGPGGGNTSN